MTNHDALKEHQRLQLKEGWASAKRQAAQWGVERNRDALNGVVIARHDPLPGLEREILNDIIDRVGGVQLVAAGPSGPVVFQAGS